MDKAAILKDRMERLSLRLTVSTVARAYIFARFSVQNQLKRHEAAFGVFVSKFPQYADMMQGAKQEDIGALGLNFHNAIWRDLSQALEIMPDVMMKVNDFSKSDKDVRQWVAENVPGLGYAKASFFLMLCGRMGVGFIDVHMGKILGVNPSKLRTRAGYEKAEKKLGKMAGMTQWLTWVDHMGIEGVGHDIYFTVQGV